jgi:hypothetical protein
LIAAAGVAVAVLGVVVAVVVVVAAVMAGTRLLALAGEGVVDNDEDDVLTLAVFAAEVRALACEAGSADSVVRLPLTLRVAAAPVTGEGVDAADDDDADDFRRASSTGEVDKC